MLEIEVVEVSVTRMGFAVMLKAPGKKKVVPIFVGPVEAYSISNALEGQSFERPLTHDLVKTILTTMKSKVEKVFVHDFKSGTFYARLFLENSENSSLSDKKINELDARPSDAIALAVRFDSPIFVAEHVYDQTSIDPGLFQEKSKDLEEELLTSLAEAMPSELLGEEHKAELLSTLAEEFPTKPENSDKKIDTSKYKSKEEVLKLRLDVAVKRERYEEAAEIRDELERLSS